VKANTNWVEIHPQLSNNGHPVDGVMGGCLVHRGLVRHIPMSRDVQMRPGVGCRVKYFTKEILASKICSIGV